jgi:hypothetical protein
MKTIKTATDKASRVATVLWQYRRELDEAAEDVSVWNAPGECWRIEANSAARRMGARLALLDVTVEEAFALLRERTTPLWVSANLFYFEPE